MTKQILDETLACCSRCMKIIPARIVEEGGRIFLEKKHCSEEKILLENDSDFFKKIELPFYFDRDFIKLDKNRYDDDVVNKLLDATGTIMVNLTTRCNMGCPICFMQSINLPKLDLSVENIDNLLKKHKHKLIVLSGGEPTVREDLPLIIRKIIKSGNTPALHTNGIKLLDRNYVKKLKKAGLKLISIPFSGTSDEPYKKLRGTSLYPIILKVLDNLKNENMDVWLCVVVAKGVNEDQIPDIIKFACENNHFIKGIWFGCLYDPNQTLEEQITPSDIIKIIEKSFNITKEDFIEEKRFRYNIYRLVGKIFGDKIQKKFEYVTERTLWLRVRERDVSVLIPIGELKLVNDTIEKAISCKSKFGSVIYLIKNLKLFFRQKFLLLLLPLIKNKFDFARASLDLNSKNILKIRVGGIKIHINEDLRRMTSYEAVGLFRAGPL